MKRTAISVVVFVLGAILSTATFAQARHDEKAHGSAAPAANVTMARTATGGRHDEGPNAHGPRKATAKTPAGADATPSPDAGKTNK